MQIHLFSHVNIRSLKQQVTLEAPIEGVRDEAEWDGFFSRHSSCNLCSRLHEAPMFATPWASSCPAAAQYRLTPQQRILMTVSSAVLRESHSAGVFGNSSAPAPGSAMLAAWRWRVP